jgi:Luciferase-like monooxygenase
MWGPDSGPFSGRHYQLVETLYVPASVHKPRPPIMIGGIGEKKTLRLVAKYADASNMFALGVDALAAKLDTLARHCEAEGRDPATIRKTILGDGDPDGFLRSMEGCAKLGVDFAEVIPVASDPVGFVAQLGETIVPCLARIPAN